MMMLVADRVWHCRMLELALEEESCLGNWLEITKKLMLTVTDTHIM